MLITWGQAHQHSGVPAKNDLAKPASGSHYKGVLRSQAAQAIQQVLGHQGRTFCFRILQLTDVRKALAQIIQLGTRVDAMSAGCCRACPSPEYRTIAGSWEAWFI